MSSNGSCLKQFENEMSSLIDSLYFFDLHNPFLNSRWLYQIL